VEASAILSVFSAVDAEFELPQIVAASVVTDALGALLHKDGASPEGDDEEE